MCARGKIYHDAGLRPCLRPPGYEAGAKTVVVRWEDDKLTRLNMEMAGRKKI